MTKHITLARHMLGNERNVQSVTISLDNQVVIMALDICKPKSSQNIIDYFLQQAEKKWKRSNKVLYKLEMTWVKGHADIRGNKKVDAKAKKVAEGKSSKASKLPELLPRNLLTLSISAVRQDYD
jgi:ribonuclease HI